MQQQFTPKHSVYVPPHISRTKTRLQIKEPNETVHPEGARASFGGVQQITHLDSGYDLLKGQKWSDVED